MISKLNLYIDGLICTKSQFQTTLQILDKLTALKSDYHHMEQKTASLTKHFSTTDVYKALQIYCLLSIGVSVSSH